MNSRRGLLSGDLMFGLNKAPDEKRLLAGLTFRGAKPFWVEGIQVGKRLKIINSKIYKDDAETLMDVVTADVRRVIVAGGVCCIDCNTPEFPRECGGSWARLDQPDETGVPPFASSLDRYHDMMKFGQIALPLLNGGSWKIPEGLVNVRIAADGSKTWQINWTNVRNEHLGMLLVVRAMTLYTVNAEYLDRLCAPGGSNIHQLAEIERAGRFLEEAANAQTKDMPKSMAGKTLERDGKKYRVL